MKAKRMNIISAVLAVGLVCISSVRNANAYFTTYVTAKGGYEVSWKHQEYIKERFEFEKWSKYITITSEEGSVPVYVRVKAFAGSTYKLEYGGEGWTHSDADGYYYYNLELLGGGTTDVLRVGIENIPKNPQEGMNFNVVVVYETIPVQYDTDGNMKKPWDANWAQGKTSQTTNGE